MNTDTTATVKNVATYSVTLSDGRQVDPGAVVEDLRMDQHNDSLVDRGQLRVVQSEVIRAPKEG